MAKNVLILGAASSLGYGYPTGEGLIKEILSSEKDQYDQDDTNRFAKVYPKLYRTLKEVPSENIDKFLRDNSSFEEDTKAIIIYTLLKRECAFAEDPDLIGEGKWYHILLSRINDYVHENGSDNINKWLKIITFNYDVSLDCFLLRGLTKNQVTSKNALDIYNQIKPKHVYGRLYEIDHGTMERYGAYRYYDCSSVKGQELNIERLQHAKSLVNNIKVIYGTKSGEIDYEIEKAKNIYFLGFGFDALNLDQLGFLSPNHPDFFEGNYSPKAERGIIGYTNFNRSRRIETMVQTRIAAYSELHNIIQLSPTVKQAFDQDVFF